MTVVPERAAYTYGAPSRRRCSKDPYEACLENWAQCKQDTGASGGFPFRVIRFGKTQTYWEYRSVDTVSRLIMELIKEYGMYRGIGFPDTVREFVLGRERKGMFLR